MAASCKGKNSWPELVGFDGEGAAAIIMTENPSVRASTFREGSYVSRDFRCDGVRVFVDERDIVSLVPKIG